MKPNVESLIPARDKIAAALREANYDLNALPAERRFEVIKLAKMERLWLPGMPEPVPQ